MMKNLVCYIILCILCVMIFGWVQSTLMAEQPSGEEVQNFVRTRMNQIRNNTRLSWDNEVILRADAYRALTALTPFEHDPSPKVRSEAYTLEWELALRTSSSTFRREVIERLVNAMCNDPDSVVWRPLYRMVSTTLTADDFTEQAKSWLRQQLMANNPRYSVVLLCGIADMQDQIPCLKALGTEAPSYQSLSIIKKRVLDFPGAEARLALARMGSQEDITYLITLIESLPLAMDRIPLLPYYGYIRQPETVKVLQQYLESEEAIAATEDTPRSPYSLYALDILARMFIDFPVPPSRFYSRADVETARAWMKAQTTFKIKR